MKNALTKLNDTELNGRRIRLIEDTKRRRRSSRSRSGTRSRSRSKSRSPRRSKSRLVTSPFISPFLGGGVAFSLLILIFGKNRPRIFILRSILQVRISRPLRDYTLGISTYNSLNRTALYLANANSSTPVCLKKISWQKLIKRWTVYFYIMLQYYFSSN